MKTEDIITLINAGYSKDDIDRMVSDQTPAQTPAQVPAPAQVQEQQAL